MRKKSIIEKTYNFLSYNIELISQVVVVIWCASIYGIIEAKYIPTENMSLPLLGRFSYYHVGLLSLMSVISFSLAICHIQWLVNHKKKYMLLSCFGCLPLSLMVEDLVWFLTRWQPIKRDEWTMITPGLGINLGITWIPLWYILTMILSMVLFYFADKYAALGYNKVGEKYA